MKANASPMSVADYCQDLSKDKIIVNDTYQRKEGLWSTQAKSFFIESILLEYPIPKIYLYAKTDLKSRQTIKEIVDGQQRSQALLSFFNNRLRLSKNIETEELHGLKYNQISEDWQSKFLSYSLPIDQFVGVPEEEVREAFRRMNSSNVPLNDEEQRNARYQGPFKWFIIGVADNYNAALGRIGVFSKRDLVRMSDLKVYSEIIHTFDEGFKTIKGKQLDDLYRKYNGTFPHEETYRNLIDQGIIYYLDRDWLHSDVFRKTHIFQSIILAAIAVQGLGEFEQAARHAHADLAQRLDAEPIELEILANAINDPEAYPGLFEFIAASTQKTNVESSRAIRFLYFKTALAIKE